MKRKKLITYMDFSGGLNIDVAPDKLKDKELSVAENVDYGQRGAASVRWGVRPLGHRGQCPDQTEMTETQIKLSADASSTLDHYKDRSLYIFDGTGRGQRRTVTTYDGEGKVATIDIPWETQPDESSEYEIVFSYEAEVAEIVDWKRKDGSNDLLAVIGNKLCKLSEEGEKTELKELSDPKIGWFIHKDSFYFTGKEGDVDKFWKYDGTTVEEVTPNAETDNDLTPIKRCRYFIWHPHSMRVFGIGDPEDRSCVYYCHRDDPTYWKKGNKVYPSTSEGWANELSLFGASLLVHYDVGMWSWIGVDPATDAVWRKLPVNHGAVRGRTVDLTPNSITFVSHGGIYVTSPSVLDNSLIMLPGENLIYNVAEGKVAAIIREIPNKENCFALFDRVKDRYILCYGVGDRNDRMLVMDWEQQAFSIYTGIYPNSLCQRTDGTILIASRNYILQFTEDYRDFDVEAGEYVPIKYKMATKQYASRTPFNIKKYKKLFIACRQYLEPREESKINLLVSYGYANDYYPEIDMNESLLWGDPWGYVWGWTDLVTKEIKIKGRGSGKGHRVQVTINSDVFYQPLTIYGIGVMLKEKKPKGVKVVEAETNI